MSALRPPSALTYITRWLRTEWVSLSLILLVVLTLYISNALTGFDRALLDLRFKLLSRPASDQVVLVTIDPKSLRELGTWPWSRTLHADAITQLDNAGAARIGVDVDFSAISKNAADQALEKAIAAANGKVVLPVFKQWTELRGDDVTYTGPAKPLAANARLGSVNVRPADDGLVRQYDRVHTWQNNYLPAFAAEVTAHAVMGTEPFEIDYGIRPETIPRIPFVDVVRGTFDADKIKGKFVIIGATAIELGDELAVPIYGALSGVELQALAAESIIQGRTLRPPPIPLDLMIALLIIILAAKWFAHTSKGLAFAALTGGTAALVIVPFLIQANMPISFATGAPIFAIGLCFIRGITQKLDVQAADLFKRASEVRERRALFETIVENNFDGIIVGDEADRIRLINPTACRLLKWSAEMAIGRPINDVLSVSGEALSDEDTDNAAPEAQETRIRRADGIDFPVELVQSGVTIEPSTGPFERRTQIRHYRIIAFRDIAERKRIEKSLANAAERAMEADRMKSEFIANMSHELRTPLNAIIGFSEVIKQEMFGPVANESYRGYARDIYASGTHLLSIINDLLEVSKIAAGKVELEEEEIDLDQAFAECMRIVRGYPGASRLILNSNIQSGCPKLLADERAIRQMLLNLLSNAIKFTPPGGNITVSAGLEPRHHFFISVEDDGIGIPPEEIANITKPFHQVESALHRKHTGTGLGLHIVQSLVELHGGTVSVTSAVSRGTRIQLNFPPERVMGFGNVIALEIHKKKS